jgi:hypothetical protein
VDWQFDEVDPEVLIEEMHTAFELTLARVLYGRYRRDRSFQQLVDAAAQAGHLDITYVGQFLPEWDQMIRRLSESDMDMAPIRQYTAKMLTSLKDARKQAKHQGRTTAKDWLTEWFYPASGALERLAEKAWTKEGWSP